MAATIVISAVLAVVVGLIICRMIKNKCHGKGGCSCGCSDCPGHCGR